MGGSHSKNTAKVAQETARTVLARKQVPTAPSSIDSVIPPTIPEVQQFTPPSTVKNSVPTQPPPAVDGSIAANLEMRQDILDQIKKWQPKSQTGPVSFQPTTESVHSIRSRIDTEVTQKNLTPLGSPPGKLTEEHLHYLFRDLRDYPHLSHAEIAKKYYLSEETLRLVTSTVQFPHLVPDTEEPGTMIALVQPFPSKIKKSLK